MKPGSAAHEGTAYQHALGGTHFAPNSFDPPFEDIVRLVRHVCGSAIALVAVTGREGLSVRACAGLDAREIAGMHAFCAHALQAGGLVEIADARSDARFAHHRLVADDAGLRFCAGAPLTNRRDGRFGSLCVFDRYPRALDADQRDGLLALARMAVALMDTHHWEADGFEPAAMRYGVAEPREAWMTLPLSGPSPQRAIDGHYAVAIIELDAGSVPAPARERVMQQIQDVAASVLGHEDVLSRDGPGELLVVFAHAAQASAALERIGAASAALPGRPRIAIGAAVGRHERDAMEDVFLEAESALHRARGREGLRLMFASWPALNA